MKSQTMSAAEFRAELKRLKLNQSSFAAVAKVPLRTVQSWALGERSIPRTARALIEIVERMSPKDLIIAITAILPEEKLKDYHDIVRITSNYAKATKALREEVLELKDEVSKLQGTVNRLQATCVFQANKLAAYGQDLQRRVLLVEPFNN